MFSFRDGASKLMDGSCSSDLLLSGYLIQHPSERRPRDIAWIGTVPDNQFLLLNTMICEGETFIVLDTEGREHIATNEKWTSLQHRLTSNGFVPRAQVVDVGQSNRWLQILEALTSASLGVLFVDAAWAVEESRFWHNLEQLWRTNPCAICLVGFYNPELNSENFSLIRTIPKELQIEFIASTASSAWIAPVEQTGDRMRELLHCSGLFGHSVPVIAREPIDLLDVFDEQGRIPLYTFNIRSNEITRLTLEHGWSHLESDGVWTNAYQGAVTLPVPTIQKMKRLRVSGNCWLHPNHEHQTLSIGIAGTTRAEFKISTGDIQILNIPLEPSDIDAGKLNLTFSVSSPGRPEEFGGEDSRLLGFKLRSVALFD